MKRGVVVKKGVSVVNVVLLLWLIGCAGQTVRSGMDERGQPAESGAAIEQKAAAVSGEESTGGAGEEREPEAAAGPEVEVFPQIGHSDSVADVAYSPDGKHIVSGSVDSTIKIWSAETGREIRTLSGHSNQVLAVSYSPNGQYILSGSEDRTLKIWDAESGREIRTLSGHTGEVRTAAYSPDGQYIVSGSKDRTLKIWDAESGREIRTLSGDSGEVWTAAYSPDGQYIVSGSWRVLKIWDAESGRELRTLSGHSFEVYTAAYSPDGQYIVSGSRDKTIRIWNAESGQELRILSGKFDSVLSVVYSPDGRYIVSGFYGRDLRYIVSHFQVNTAVRIWDAETGQELRTISGHSSAVQSVAYSPDGRYIVSGSRDKAIKIWDAETGREIRTLSGNGSEVYSATYSPDGRSIVSGFGDTIIRIWDIKSGRETRALSGHSYVKSLSSLNPGAVYSVAYSLDGQYIVSGSEDNTLKIWDAESGRELRTLSGHYDRITSVAFSPNGRYIISGSEDSTLKIWDAESGRELRTLSGNGSDVYSATYSPDGRYIVYIAGSGSSKILDAESGWELRTLSGHSPSVVAYSPDGKSIVSGAGDGTLNIWDAESGQELRTLSGHSDWVSSVDYSPDGRSIVSGSGDHSLKIWDAESGRELRTLSGHSNTVSSAAYSPDGLYIISGSSDNTLKIWDASTGVELAQFIAFTDGEWIVITPDGYYNASPRGDEHLNIRIGNEVYGIDQFSAAFYHPEVVEARLQGLPDPPVVQKRGSIKTASIPPALKVSASDEDQSTRQAVLSVTATDWIRQIDTVEIIVNGRLVGGAELQPLTANGLVSDNTRLAAASPEKRFAFTLPVNLDPGYNHIEVVAANDYNYGLGTLQINMPETGAEQKGDVWVLAIGINDYVENPFYKNLNYGASDAKKIIDSFKAQEGKRFDRVHTLYVSNNGEVTPTRENILASMDFLKQAGPNDTAVLFVAAHGKTEEGVYYFLSSDTVFTSNGKFDTKTAVNIDDLTKALDIPGRKLVFLDTCESGGVDNNRLVRTLKNRSTVIFTASQQEESSLESRLYGGFFTDGITRGLNGEAAEHGVVSIDRLGDYVIKRVIGISRDRQHPVKLIPEGFRNFVITLVE